MTSKLACLMVVVGGIAAASAGCGSSDGLDRKEVSGTVTFDGKPLPNGSIQFQPKAADGGVAVSGGSTIEAGRYRIRREQGLTPGTYQVVILSHASSLPGAEDELPGQMTKAPKELIPAQYNVKTTLTAAVTADGKNVFDFDLTK